ncbi:MAG: hypothetical protein RR313_02015 [Anaerovoracaceae bacterium]
MKIKKRLNKYFRKTVTIGLTVSLVCSFTIFGYGATYPNVRPAINAKGAVTYCEELNKVVYSKNMHKKLDPLSTTKLLTVMIAADSVPLDTVVTIDARTARVGEASIFLKEGEKITVRDLMYAALLPSANDAAYALGMAVSGNMNTFTRLMNEKAKQLGAQNSFFTNPNGLLQKIHYSTAYDMMLISKAALSNPIVQEIDNTEKHIIPKTNKTKRRVIYTTNSFLVDGEYAKYGAFGGKTGTWDYYNSALIIGYKQEGHTFYSVLLKDRMDTRYKDMVKIINYSKGKVLQL